MHEEQTFATFPAAPYPDGSPAIDLLSTAAAASNFDDMKRSFDAVNLSGNGALHNGVGPAGGAIAGGSANGDKKQRYAGATAASIASPFVQQQQQASYSDVYGSASAAAATGSNGSPGALGYGQNGGGGLYGGHAFAAGVTAPPFIPGMQSHQHQPASHSSQGGFSGPGSPYLGVGSPNLNATASFGSPAAQNGQLPGHNASAYSGGPYDTMPSSPNSYAVAAAAAAAQASQYGSPFGSPLNFGNQFLGLMPGMMGMGMTSPQMGGASLQGNVQYPMPYQIMGQNGVSAGGPSGQSGRTVYVGNLPSDASVDELLNQVRFGPIDSVKILPEKSCAFISFLDPTTAAAFHSDALMRKVRLHDQDLKIGWGKPSSVPANIVMAVQQSGATRNVYLGNLDDTITEQSLRDDLSRFGPIDQVKIVRDRAIAFVHFLSIATAVKVVQALATEPEWSGKRVNFGKDRCAYVPKNQHQQQQHNMAAAAMGSLAANYGGFNAFSPGFAGGFAADGSPQQLDPNHQPGNRTIYLGNIHPESTTEEICNTIRGGILQQIRYIPDKHICFVTFVDTSCALAFFQMATYQGITLHNRRLKIGWGKNSGPTPPGIAMVVQSGGSRNVYIGNIEDFEAFSEERLRKDFGEYGDIELVNSLPAKNASFVNYTNIANAIKAIEGMKQHPEYSKFRISYGKDRCGGSPKHNFRSGHPNHNSHNTAREEQGLGLSPGAENFDTTPLEDEVAGGIGALVMDESVAAAAVPQE